MSTVVIAAIVLMLVLGVIGRVIRIGCSCVMIAICLMLLGGLVAALLVANM